MQKLCWRVLLGCLLIYCSSSQRFLQDYTYTQTGSSPYKNTDSEYFPKGIFFLISNISL